MMFSNQNPHVANILPFANSNNHLWARPANVNPKQTTEHYLQAGMTSINNKEIRDMGDETGKTEIDAGLGSRFHGLIGGITPGD